jgi:hypothetical protein
MAVGNYREKSLGRILCKADAQKDVKNEIFAIGFGKRIMGTEWQTEKQVV